MTGESERIARIDERVKAHEKAAEKLGEVHDTAIGKLEKNQRWAVLGILGLLGKAVADVLLGKGAGL